MTQAHSRARQQTELAFAKAQSQSRFLARNLVVNERASNGEARREQTLRLKNARVTKGLEGGAGPPSQPSRIQPSSPDVQANET
jgi:hypothetical protein